MKVTDSQLLLMRSEFEESECGQELIEVNTAIELIDEIIEGRKIKVCGSLGGDGYACILALGHDGMHEDRRPEDSPMARATLKEYYPDIDMGEQKAPPPDNVEHVKFPREPRTVTLVVHRDGFGEVEYVHSPMDDTTTIQCEICNSGKPVQIDTDDLRDFYRPGGAEVAYDGARAADRVQEVLARDDYAGPSLDELSPLECFLKGADAVKAAVSKALVIPPIFKSDESAAKCAKCGHVHIRIKMCMASLGGWPEDSCACTERVGSETP